jgi:uncharacterized membrane protein
MWREESRVAGLFKLSRLPPGLFIVYICGGANHELLGLSSDLLKVSIYLRGRQESRVCWDIVWLVVAALLAGRGLYEER